MGEKCCGVNTLWKKIWVQRIAHIKRYFLLRHPPHPTLINILYLDDGGSISKAPVRQTCSRIVHGSWAKYTHLSDGRIREGRIHHRAFCLFACLLINGFFGADLRLAMFWGKPALLHWEENGLGYGFPSNYKQAQMAFDLSCFLFND